MAAVDPSAPFVAACRERFPEVDVRRAAPSRCRSTPTAFDAAAACLVVHFMTDPVAGLAEMARVTGAGGWVGATVWDLAGSRAPMWPLWEAVAEIAPDHPGEREFQGGSREAWSPLFEGAGLTTSSRSSSRSPSPTRPSRSGGSPTCTASDPRARRSQPLGPDGRARLEEILRRNLGDGPFDLTAVAYAARGRA